MSPKRADAAARARRVLAAAGMSGTTALLPVPSGSNEVWLGDEVALRINTRGDGSLGREAAVGRLLPAAARYPGVLGHGHLGPLEWILTPRVPGVPLAHTWPTLSTRERRVAIEQLGGALAALHHAAGFEQPTDRDLRGPHVLPADRMIDQIRWVGRHRHVSPGMIEACLARVELGWSAFESSGDRVLVHGDLHLENVLWHQGEVTAVLDLEWTRRSWREVDLEILLAFCGHPRHFVAGDHAAALDAEDLAPVPAWLRSVYPELFAQPHRQERLTLLGLSRAFGSMVDVPPPLEVPPADLRDPRNRIEALLKGQAWWLALP